MFKYILAYKDNYKKRNFKLINSIPEAEIAISNHKHMGNKATLFKRVCSTSDLSCEYCENNNRELTSRGDLENMIASIDENDKEIIIDLYDQNGNNYQEYISINYCPMCGKNLKEEQNEN